MEELNIEHIVSSCNFYYFQSLLDFGEVFKWEKGYVNLKGQVKIIKICSFT